MSTQKLFKGSSVPLWGVERLGIKSIIVTDGPHGIRKSENISSTDFNASDAEVAICYPTASALACSFSEELIFKNTWYRPIEDEEIMKLALKYTLSKSVTAAIPPGQYTLFLKALEFMNDFNPITENETSTLLSLAKETEPVFMHA